MELLTNKTKVAEVLQVAIGYNDAEFDVFIREAQDFDLRPLLCEAFYADLITNKEDGDIWQLLLEGGTYTFENRTYYFRSLQDVLAYFAYARFILKCNYVSTSHGFTIKKTNYSEPVPLEERKNMYYKYQKEAHILLDDVKRFVEKHTDDYPSYSGCKETSGKPHTGSFKTYIVK
ncbi:hypothetical protein NBRC110019_20970 [Neptunitalea chrysea]|uniref:Uncharacterized protein n=1 Tax=Neptunitalea chrysea TaxID=1647581 RepID=A0A9W6B762_9FLAO|nr:hypothetical protein [Neptunitalea chrysea]GLB53057.1 hypothetical protein NBRC110019_20970 [Neptunitalea chrysea]